MGRPFVIELEEPVYKCKDCQTHLAVPNDIMYKMTLSPRISQGVPETPEVLYEFSRLSNMFLGQRAIPSRLIDIFCVGCSTSIGSYNKGIFDAYWVSRRNLHGPEGSDDEV